MLLSLLDLVQPWRMKQNESVMIAMHFQVDESHKIYFFKLLPSFETLLISLFPAEGAPSNTYSL